MNPEKEKRIMLKQQRQQRVKVQLWERFQIGKIYPKSLQSIFHKGAITFFFRSNESTVCDSGCTVAALENFQE